MIIFWNN